MARSWIGWAVNITEIFSKKLPGDFFNTIDPKRTPAVDQHRMNEHLSVVELRSSVFASVLKLFLNAALLKIVSQPKCCA